MIRYMFFLIFLIQIVSCDKKKCVTELSSEGTRITEYCYWGDSSKIEKRKYNPLNNNLEKRYFYFDGKAYLIQYYNDKIQLISKCNLIYKDTIAYFIANGIASSYSLSPYNLKFVFEVKNNLVLPQGKIMMIDSLDRILSFGKEYSYNTDIENKGKQGNWYYFNQFGDLIRIEKYKNDSLISIRIINKD